MAQNVLICSENTSNEEICSFLFRAFYDEKKNLYIMINSEKLNIEKTNKLIALLKELKYKTDDGIKSVLIFANKKDTSNISEQIRELNNKQNIELQEMRNKIDIIPKITNNNTEIIYSFKPGFGKSKYIKSKFKNKNYSYFPVGGDSNLEELLNRLKYAIKRRNVGLHIDILDTDSEEILEIINQFLFSSLVMNYFSFNGNICYIRNNEIDIKVEIPSSLIDNFIKFPILNYFNKKGIYKISIGKFNIYSKKEVIIANEKYKKEKENLLKEKSLIISKENTPTIKILEEEKKLEEFLKTKESLYLIDNDIYVNYQEKENKIFPVIKQYNNFVEILDIPLFKNIKNDLLFNITEIPRDTDSNMQIVCNYLYLLKNNLLNQQNIFIFDSFKDTNLNLEVLQNTKVTP